MKLKFVLTYIKDLFCILGLIFMCVVALVLLYKKYTQIIRDKNDRCKLRDV